MNLKPINVETEIRERLLRETRVLCHDQELEKLSKLGKQGVVVLADPGHDITSVLVAAPMKPSHCDKDCERCAKSSEKPLIPPFWASEAKGRMGRNTHGVMHDRCVVKEDGECVVVDVARGRGHGRTYAGIR